MEQIKKVSELLIKHYKKHPKMQQRDLFKYLFQSAFGCEHLVADGGAVLEYIRREYETVPKSAPPLIEALDGEYSRVHLSVLNGGLKPETLAKLFLLSAKKEKEGIASLEKKLEVAKRLVAEGDLPFDLSEFEKAADEWRSAGYPAVRHSDEFRSEYRPAYRVISNRYVNFLELFKKIDGLLDKGRAVIAVEGGSASGKTTLSDMLREIYGCSVIHMDDFFLRPEQRTPERFAQIGGNIDRERFFEEVVLSLTSCDTVRYRPFDCHTQTLGEEITVFPGGLTVVEGVYSTHPSFGRYFDLSVFIDIDAEYQKQRIIKRNSPQFANRFFNEWIPLENAYFDGTDIKKRSDLVINVDAFE